MINITPINFFRNTVLNLHHNIAKAVNHWLCWIIAIASLLYATIVDIVHRIHLGDMPALVGKGFAIASAGALAYLPMNSNADWINLWTIPQSGSGLGSAEMVLSHDSKGEEKHDSGDGYWEAFGGYPWGSDGIGEEPDKYLRPFSDQIGFEGWEQYRDNRPLESMEDFPLYVDAQDNIGTGITSYDNTIKASISGDWDDDQDRKDYSIEAFIFNESDDSMTKIWEGGIRKGIDESSNGEYTLPFTFDVANASDGDRVLYMNAQPVDYVIPEPSTGLLSLLGISAAGAAAYRRRRFRNKSNS